jgi:hypothetical protein
LSPARNPRTLLRSAREGKSRMRIMQVSAIWNQALSSAIDYITRKLPAAFARTAPDAIRGCFRHTPSSSIDGIRGGDCALHSCSSTLNIWPQR